VAAKLRLAGGSDTLALFHGEGIHMLRYGALCLIVLLSGCGANQPPAPAPPQDAPREAPLQAESATSEIVCSEPRPQVCTMECNPVCALRDGGQRETLSSPCNACADADVVSHLPGACDSDA
jgi:hypothetical protein